MEKPKKEITEWFGIRRENFILDPQADADFYAPRTGIDPTELTEDLEVDLTTGLAPKRFFWGPYGSGKTHTLHTTVKNLQKLIKICPVYIECPNLFKSSSFIDLYREGIMKAMGQDFVLTLLNEIFEKTPVRPAELYNKLKEILGDEEMARAVSQIIRPDFDRKWLWAWISGAPVKSSELEKLGLTHDLTEAEPARLAEVIIILGRLIKHLRQETLTIILDEMERMGKVGVDTAPTFRTAFTKLCDPSQKDVAILFGYSADQMRDLPDVISGPVLSRIGADALVEIPALIDQDVDGFIQSIIGYIRDPSADISKLTKDAKSKTKEKIDRAFFPFTPEAIETLKSALGTQMTPREIVLKMTKAAGRAYKYNKPVVTADCIPSRGA